MLKSDIRFHHNAHQNLYQRQKFYTETSFNMDLKNFFFFFFFFFFLNQISNVQYCLKLQNIIYFIVNLKKHH